MFKKIKVRLSSLLNSLFYTLSVKENVDLRGANSKYVTLTTIREMHVPQSRMKVLLKKPTIFKFYTEVRTIIELMDRNIQNIKELAYFSLQMANASN